MAHYVFLDANNIVTLVIMGRHEDEDGIDWEQFYSNEIGQPCKRTSFNTYGNVHKTGGIPFRKNFAGIGFKYDEVRDAFIPPQPFASWVLNDDTCLWNAPVAMPTDDKPYIWDEESLTWIEIT